MLSVYLSSLRWKASMTPFVVDVVVHSSELHRNIGAMHALNILTGVSVQMAFPDVVHVVHSC